MKKLTALFCLFFSLSALSAIDVLNFSSPQQERDYHSLTQELRCPQCQNNNIADSNATIAVDMRHKVYELLQAGNSKDEIVQYMVDRYGNFVTYNPPLTVATIALWVIPASLLLFGILLLWRRKGKAHKSAVDFPPVLNDEQQQRLQQLLKEKE